MLVPCPHCGPRDAAEFHGGSPPRRRPDAASATPAGWRSYLHDQPNPAGGTRELWFHAAGCRRYLLVERDTVSGEVHGVEPVS